MNIINNLYNISRFCSSIYNHNSIWKMTTLSSEVERDKNSSFHRFLSLLFGADFVEYSLVGGSLYGKILYLFLSCVLHPEQDEIQILDSRNACIVS